MMQTNDREMLIEAARADYADENVQIDDNATILPAETGSWVAAWVWVQDRGQDRFEPPIRLCNPSQPRADEE
jgi:hypothetical protein